MATGGLYREKGKKGKESFFKRSPEFSRKGKKSKPRRSDRRYVERRERKREKRVCARIRSGKKVKKKRILSLSART